MRIITRAQQCSGIPFKDDEIKDNTEYRFQVGTLREHKWHWTTIDANCVNQAAQLGFEQLDAEEVYLFSWLGAGKFSGHFYKSQRGKPILKGNPDDEFWESPPEKQ